MTVENLALSCSRSKCWKGSRLVSRCRYAVSAQFSQAGCLWDVTWRSSTIVVSCNVRLNQPTNQSVNITFQPFRHRLQNLWRFGLDYQRQPWRSFLTCALGTPQSWAIVVSESSLRLKQFQSCCLHSCAGRTVCDTRCEPTKQLVIFIRHQCVATALGVGERFSAGTPKTDRGEKSDLARYFFRLTWNKA